MITGHNTDITYNGVIYHVQTEDKGETNPVVETLVYKGGEILDARRTSYEELVKDGYDEGKIISLIEEQHRQVISEIKGGKYDSGLVIADALAEVINIDSRKSLDQVILDYLASQEQKERLIIELKNNADFTEGGPCLLHIQTRNGTSSDPVTEVKIVVKIISTVKKPLTIIESKTDRNGMLRVEFVMPDFADGNAALLIQGFSEIGNDELKFFINKKKQIGSLGKKS